MKKTASLTLILSMIFTITALAAADSASSDEKAAEKAEEAFVYEFPDHETDELKWNFDQKTGELRISGKGPMRDYLEYAPEWDEYYNDILKIVIDKGVTSVGAQAFYAYPNLTEVILPEGIEYIGYSAFYYSQSLRSLELKEGIKAIADRAFYNALLHPDGQFILPEGLEYVGDEAFHSSVKEGTIIIPETLKHIGKKAFTNGYFKAFSVSEDNEWYCDKDGILYDKDVTELICYPAETESRSYDIPDTVKIIREESVNVAAFLEEINIPKNVELIEEASIFCNYALTDIHVDKDNAFYKDIDGVLFTADETELIAYPSAKPADGYKIPKTVKRIGSSAFDSKSDLCEVKLPEGLESIGKSAFIFTSLSGDIALPGTVKEISQNGLSYLNKVESIDLGKSLEALGPETMKRCPALTRVYLPASLKTVDCAAFGYSPSDYPALTEIVFKGSEKDWNKIEFTGAERYAPWNNGVKLTFEKK